LAPTINYTRINFGGFQSKLTQYRTSRGWFGDANRTFNALQQGDQNLAGVKFNIYDLPPHQFQLRSCWAAKVSEQPATGSERYSYRQESGRLVLPAHGPH
jgi:hypothetical protein